MAFLIRRFSGYTKAFASAPPALSSVGAAPLAAQLSTPRSPILALPLTSNGDQYTLNSCFSSMTSKSGDTLMVLRILGAEVEYRPGRRNFSNVKVKNKVIL